MLKDIFKKTFINFGPLFILETLRYMLKGPSVTILFGHRVLPDEIINNQNHPDTIAGQTSVSEIDRLIESLSPRFDFISLDEAISKLKSKSLKKNSLVLTFDDGFKDNYTYLLPVLKKHNVPATFYINTSVIGTNNSLWFQAAFNLFFTIPAKNIRIEINSTDYNLSTHQDRYFSAFSFIKYLQKEHEPQNFMAIINDIDNKLCMPTSESFHLDWKDLTALCHEPLITIGAHTDRHFPLGLCSSELARKEITLSKTKLEERLPITISHFCFPRGQLEDFTSEHIDEIKSLGMLSATTTVGGVNNAGADLFRLKRIGIPQIIRNKEHELIWYVTAIPQLISKIKSYVLIK